MKYCGREFPRLDILAIRAIIAKNADVSRYRLSVLVCEHLDWRKPNGELKDMSCRVAMIRMHDGGVICLPTPRGTRPATSPTAEKLAEVGPPLGDVTDLDLGQLQIDLVVGKKESLLWNAYIHRYHYLGHSLIPGAQLRYLVRSEDNIVALLSFGASAWKVKPRDDYIGWSQAQRVQNLQFIVNNSRFLILPWIKKKNLASKILSLISKRLPRDWLSRYNYSPVLMETFVEQERFRGTCYCAANWQYLGQTKGRGKLDRHKQCKAPIKGIWIYPLTRDFKEKLCRQY